MSKGIAFFDFDGTITTRDTLLEFIKYCKGKPGFYTGFLLNSPYLVAFKLKIISNQLAKEKVFQYFFRNTPAADFQRLCDQFAEKKIDALVRPGALQEIERLKREGTTIVIVSASPVNWIKKWADKHSLLTIATILEFKDDRVTGKIVGNNCHGMEKVRRIKEQYDLSKFAEVYAYGDSSGDKPMLALANHAHYRPFRD